MNIVEAFRSGISSFFKKHGGYATYEEAKEIYETAKEKGRLTNVGSFGGAKKIGNNTYIVANGKLEGVPVYGIRLHNTDIITLLPNGDYLLNSEGWRTPLTKSRFETYLPISIWNHKGKWYFRNRGSYDPNQKAFLFTDGMVLNKNGCPLKYKQILEYASTNLVSLKDNIQFISDEPILKKILTKTNNAAVVVDGISRIDDEKFIRKLAWEWLLKNDASSEGAIRVISECIKKIEDIETFAKKALTEIKYVGASTQGETMPLLIAKIKDQKFLQKYIEDTFKIFLSGKVDLWSLIVAAAKRVKNQKFLIKLFERFELTTDFEMGTPIGKLLSLIIKDGAFIKMCVEKNIEDERYVLQQIVKHSVLEDKEFLMSLLDKEISAPIADVVFRALVNFHNMDENQIQDIVDDKTKSNPVRETAKKYYIQSCKDVSKLRKIALDEPHLREKVLETLKKLDPEFVNKMKKRKWGSETFDEDIKEKEENQKIYNYKKQLLRLLLPLAV